MSTSPTMNASGRLASETENEMKIYVPGRKRGMAFAASWVTLTATPGVAQANLFTRAK
jgi:hypothetical protein